MSLTQLLSASAPGVGSKCRVTEALRSMPTEEVDAFNQLITNPAWSSTHIAMAMQGMGYDVKGSHVRYYRGKIREGAVILESR